MKRILDERQEKFVTFYVATGNASKSAEMAGYSHPKQKGYDLKSRFAPEIEERTRNKIGDKVVSVIDMTYELAMNADSEGRPRYCAEAPVAMIRASQVYSPVPFNVKGRADRSTFSM